MVRPLRIEYEGALYHVMSRGNDVHDGQMLRHQGGKGAARWGSVFHHPSDYDLFLNVMRELAERYNVIFYAYCLMSNHYHLFLATLDPNLSIFMRQLNGIFTQRMNKKYKRRGHLFQGRYKAILVEKESYLLEVSRYIVLNPVRAKMVKSAYDWKWSSYRSIIREDKYWGDYLGRDELLACFETKDAATAVREYKSFVKEGIGKESPFAQDKGSLYLGSDEFFQEFARVLTGRRDLKEIPRASRYADRPSLEDIFAGVGSRKDRNERIKCAHREWGYKHIEIAEALGVHYSTVSLVVSGRREK